MKKCVALCILLVGMQVLFAQKPAKNLRIAYNVLENQEADDYEVYSMLPDGSQPKNITRNPDVAWTYSACDDKLYWISDRDTCRRCYFLYESDADGQHVRRVSGLRLEDSWFGSRNACSELIVSGRLSREVRSQLFIIDLRTGDFRQITTDTAARFSDPTFSPDGSQIVYRYKKKKRDRTEPDELWIAAADGSQARQLTFYPKNDTTAKWHDYHAGAPHWNAKHGFITFQSKQAGKYRLFSITPDGKKQVELHDFQLGAGWHDWSPDGRWLAVELFENDSKPGDIWLFDYRKKRLKQLTFSPDKFENSPVWVRKRD